MNMISTMVHVAVANSTSLSYSNSHNQLPKAKDKKLNEYLLYGLAFHHGIIYICTPPLKPNFG